MKTYLDLHDAMVELVSAARSAAAAVEADNAAAESLRAKTSNVQIAEDAERDAREVLSRAREDLRMAELVARQAASNAIEERREEEAAEARVNEIMTEMSQGEETS